MCTCMCYLQLRNFLVLSVDGGHQRGRARGGVREQRESIESIEQRERAYYLSVDGGHQRSELLGVQSLQGECVCMYVCMY
jgi:hypothetical protein